MIYEKVNIKAKTSWRVSRIIGLFVILLICAAGLMIADSALDSIHFAVYIVVGVIILYFITTIIIYPEIEYNQWRFAITDDKVEIRHGIFYIKTTVIPILRIQHITISQGPVNRYFKLYNVSISLASGTFEIEGLSKDKADTISNNLKDRLYKRMEEGSEA